ncbi:hypothetical protein FIBSPDRAFT_890829 [Athelia psychrophila]|uniref:Uncharacterized protein n=1 Tax=Athelia psychrophila TaxID=1759441 RepID=A0A166KE45_9AGAM|nr:hypothetical protein FIBSPDRAFT_890829 [Fibularhizoctonia sp. CBS 109695]
MLPARPESASQNGAKRKPKRSQERKIELLVLVKCRVVRGRANSQTGAKRRAQAKPEIDSQNGAKRPRDQKSLITYISHGQHQPADPASQPNQPATPARCPSNGWRNVMATCPPPAGEKSTAHPQRIAGGLLASATEPLKSRGDRAVIAFRSALELKAAQRRWGQGTGELQSDWLNEGMRGWSRDNVKASGMAKIVHEGYGAIGYHEPVDYADRNVPVKASSRERFPYDTEASRKQPGSKGWKAFYRTQDSSQERPYRPSNNRGRGISKNSQVVFSTEVRPRNCMTSQRQRSTLKHFKQVVVTSQDIHVTRADGTIPD